MLKFFKKYPEVLAVMSEREDGSMRLLKGNEASLINREEFFKKIGADNKKVISAGMAHGNTVEIVDKNSEELIYGSDGLATKDREVFLSVTVADCVPVYFCESKSKIVGIAHAGWRGIVDGIVESVILKITSLGGKTENIKVALGPGINQCHFEIKEDVLGEFEKHSDFIERKGDKIFVNLKGIIKKQLLELGVEPENIENNSECTFENPEKYFSFRGDSLENSGVMVAVIEMK